MHRTDDCVRCIVVRNSRHLRRGTGLLQPSHTNNHGSDVLECMVAFAKLRPETDLGTFAPVQVHAKSPQSAIIGAAESLTKRLGLRADDEPTMWDEAILLIFERLPTAVPSAT